MRRVGGIGVIIARIYSSEEPCGRLVADIILAIFGLGRAFLRLKLLASNWYGIRRRE